MSKRICLSVPSTIDAPSLVRVDAAGIEAFSDPVTFLQLDAPGDPKPGELLIDVHVAGVGHWDEFARRGDWDLGIRPPMALGVEAAGVVRAVGGRSHFQIGDRVVAHSAPLRVQGAWAEQFLLEVSDAAALPESVDFETAAAFAVPALTADQTLRDVLSVKEKEMLFVNGGSGVTGRLLVQIASNLGARVITTASVKSADRLRETGAAEVVDYRSPSWGDAVLAWSGGGGVDVAVNAVPGAAAAVERLVRSGGRLATLTSDPPASARGVEVKNVFVSADGPRLQRLVELLERGKLALAVEARYGLADAGDALNRKGTGGATVLNIR
jgi:NADPH:quinone reductase-like Zn-dependent oxidoreductase